MFKKLNRKNLSWDDVSRLVYGVPDYAGNLSKMNNDTETDEILVPADDDYKTDKQGLQCGIDGVIYTDFQKAFTLDFIDGVRGAVFIFTYEPQKHNFKKNQNACVYDENGLFLKGTVKDYSPVKNSGGNLMQLEVISSCGVLISSDVPPPLDFKYLSAKAVIERICGYWSIAVEFGGCQSLDYVASTGAGNSYCAGESEKAWDFICRIAKSAGCLVTDTGSGLFVGRIEEKEASMSFIEGEAIGVTEWKPLINTNNLARYYEAHSQYPEISCAKAVIPFDYPVIKRVPNEDVSSGVLQEFLNWYVCREVGKAYQQVLSVDDNLNLYTGDFATIQNSDIFGGKAVKMVVVGKRALYPGGNIFTFSLPCAVTGILPEELPE